MSLYEKNENDRKIANPSLNKTSQFLPKKRFLRKLNNNNNKAHFKSGMISFISIAPAMTSEANYNHKAFIFTSTIKDYHIKAT